MLEAMNGVDFSTRTTIDVNPEAGQEEYDNQGCTALHLAVSGDHVKVINTLLLLKWNAKVRLLSS